MNVFDNLDKELKTVIKQLSETEYKLESRTDFIEAFSRKKINKDMIKSIFNIF